MKRTIQYFFWGRYCIPKPKTMLLKVFFFAKKVLSIFLHLKLEYFLDFFRMKTLIPTKKCRLLKYFFKKNILKWETLPDVVHWRPKVVCPVGEGAVGPVLDAVAAVVRVVDAHARLVVLEVVAPLSVPGGAVEEGATGIKKNRFVCLLSGK